MRRGEGPRPFPDGVSSLGIHLKRGRTVAAGGYILVMKAEQRNKEEMKIIEKPAKMESSGSPANGAYDGWDGVERDGFASGPADEKHTKHPFPGN